MGYSALLISPPLGDGLGQALSARATFDAARKARVRHDDAPDTSPTRHPHPTGAPL